MFFEFVRIGAGIVGGMVSGYGTHLLLGPAAEAAATTTARKAAVYVAETAIGAAGAKCAYKAFSLGRDLEDDELMMEAQIQKNWENLSKKNVTAK